MACQKLGTGHYHNGQCVIECDNAGIGKLKTSTGLSFPILKTQIGEKSLAISHNDTTCYVPLAPGVGELNISYDGQVYHAFAPDEIEPE